MAQGPALCRARRSNGPGWVLEDQYGRFKIQKIEAGGAREPERPTISTTIALRAQQQHRRHRSLVS